MLNVGNFILLWVAGFTLTNINLYNYTCHTHTYTQHFHIGKLVKINPQRAELKKDLHLNYYYIT